MIHTNFIIMTGSGKKIGKTHLAVALIHHFSKVSEIIGLKISPHIHDNLGKVELVAGNSNFRIFRESEIHEKNSGRYLEAGAVESYFIETGDDFLTEAIRAFQEKCNPHRLPVVCESGALGSVIRPGVLIFIEDPLKKNDPVKESQKRVADLVIPARAFDPERIIEKICLVEGKWLLHL
jgi:hypothetical protein